MGDTAGIGWLHLSDLFVDWRGGSITRSEIRELLEQDLRRVHAVSGPWDLVTIGGNITRNGDVEEFGGANQVVEWLWAVLHRLGSEPSLVLVPGPADRGASGTGRTGWTSTPLRGEGSPASRHGVASQLVEFARFSERQRLRQGHVRSGMFSGDISLDIDRNGLRVGVLGLNSSFDPDDALASMRITAACGASVAEWTRHSDAVILIAPREAELIAEHFADHPAPVIWLCGERSPALTMMSHEGRTYLVISAPQLYAPSLDTFGYSTGRLWITDDQAYVRVWHRCLTGDPELRRLGPPRDAIVDRDGAFTLSLPLRGAPPAADPAGAPSSAGLARGADEMQIRHLAWSPDGRRIAAIGGLRTLVVYGRDRTPIVHTVVPDAPPEAIAWSPDGNRLATRSRSHVHIWTADGVRLHGTELPCPAPAAMAWTASGRLALGSDHGAHLWNPHDAGVQDPGDLASASRRTLRAAPPVLALAVSPWGGILAEGTSEGVLLTETLRSALPPC